MTPKGFLGACDSAAPCTQMINLATVMKKDLMARKNKVRNYAWMYFYIIYMYISVRLCKYIYGVMKSISSRIQKLPYSLFSLMERKHSKDGPIRIVYTDPVT